MKKFILLFALLALSAASQAQNDADFSNLPNGQCKRGIDRATEIAQRYAAEIANAASGAMLGPVCASLKTGIVAQWSNQECANDPALSATLRRQSQQQAHALYEQNKQLERAAISIDNDNKPCDLSEVEWTGLARNYSSAAKTTGRSGGGEKDFSGGEKDFSGVEQDFSGVEQDFRRRDDFGDGSDVSSIDDGSDSYNPKPMQRHLAEIAARKERERLAKLERERKERERLAKLERERKERERLAKLERERKERERLAKLEREHKERERLAEEKREQQQRVAKQKSNSGGDWWGAGLQILNMGLKTYQDIERINSAREQGQRAQQGAQPRTQQPTQQGVSGSSCRGKSEYGQSCSDPCAHYAPNGEGGWVSCGIQ